MEGVQRAYRGCAEGAESVQRAHGGCTEGCGGDMQAIENILGCMEGMQRVQGGLWWGHVGN